MIESAPQDRNGKTVTIMDVARAAGVSKSTVSRVLDDRLPPSRSPNAERVRRAAAELGYSRDVFASGLRQGRTNTIGVIVPRLTDTAMATFFEAVSRACDRRRKFAVVATTDNDPEGAHRAVDTLLRRRVDGLIFAADRQGDPTASRLRDSRIPHVCALRSEGSSSASLGDDVLGGYLATRHLLDLGHRRIALLSGPDFASNSRGRAEGYRRALEEQGIETDPLLIRPTDFTVNSAAEAASHLLDSGTDFSAIFAATDNIAIGAVSVLARQGQHTPEDVSVVGYNDIPLAGHLPTPLTSVRVPFDEIAANALTLLEGQSGETAPETRISTPTLIPRSSTRRL